MESIPKSERQARGRLQDLVRGSGTSLAALSRMIGRNPAYLQQYVTRGSPRHLDEPDLRKIAEFLGVSTRVIETRRFDDARYDAPPQRRAASSGQGESADGNWIEVARLPLGASAGPGAFAAEEISYDSFRFSRRWLREMGLDGADLSSIRVEGDSMEPMLRDGDEILIDRSPRPFRDGIHVVRLGDTLMVKRVASAGQGRIALLSQNMAYPPVEVAADEVEIIGRVVWKSGRI